MWNRGSRFEHTTEIAEFLLRYPADYTKLTQNLHSLCNFLTFMICYKWMKFADTRKKKSLINGGKGNLAKVFWKTAYGN